MERIKKYEPLWGKWTVTRKIGEGSFGAVVYEAEKTDAEGQTRSCVVKLIPFRNAVRLMHDGEKDVRKRILKAIFMEESLGGEHIVDIYDYDMFPRENTTDIIIRMELLTNLNEYRKIHKTNPEELRKLVIRLGIHIGKALEKCEEEKIVHGDIEPNNIFVNKNGTFKLGNFGLLRKMNELVPHVARNQRGTALYIAPEIPNWSEKNDYLSDIYSLGIVMYQLLNDGNIPFVSDMENFEAVYDAIGKRADGEEIPSPKHEKGKLWKIIQKACQYKKEDRYQSAIEMRKDLEKLKYRKVNNYNIGDSLFFGSYPQDADGTEKPIEWIILKKEGDKVLLLSKYILDAKPYNNKFEEVTWETSDIRRWLNNKFYTNAFNESEQEKIHNGFIKTEDNPRYRTNGGNDTEDKVFLLSIKEVEILLPNDKGRKAKATEYAQKMGSYVGRNTGDSVWWLRSPGYDGFCAVVMQEKYAWTSEDGDDVNRADDGVRPVLWLSIES